VIDGAPLTGPNTTFWPITRDGATIGKVTSAIHSPRLKQNIALAMVCGGSCRDRHGGRGDHGTGTARATMVDRPFYDPKKTLAAA
jgi:glycine cleavage system aminomethyltransferase T